MCCCFDNKIRCAGDMPYSGKSFFMLETGSPAAVDRQDGAIHKT